MPRVTKKQVKPTESYRALQYRSDMNRENNDCTVRMMAVVTGLPYEQCREALSKQGRKSGRGAYPRQTKAAIRSLGFKVQEISPRVFIDQYPGKHKNKKYVTTFQPARFNKVWRDGHNYYLSCRSHESKRNS